MDITRIALEAEQIHINDFIRLYNLSGLDPALMIYDSWDTHDILVLTWHESFARTVDDLARGVQPTPEPGRIEDINARGMVNYRDASIRIMLRKLRKAQRTIENHILDPSVELIPYRKSGPSYSPVQHLNLVRDHIRRHFWDVLTIQFRQLQQPHDGNAS